LTTSRAVDGGSFEVIAESPGVVVGQQLKIGTWP
jgi:hypothetical protein